MKSERSLDRGIAKAVRYFWTTRQGQARKQQASGQLDQGSRGAVTGGKPMDGFNLVYKLAIGSPPGRMGTGRPAWLTKSRR